MSKNTLEALLLEVGNKQESIDKLVEENKKSVLQNTMEDAINQFIKEAVEDDDDLDSTNDDMEYDEADVDTETGEELEAAGEEELGAGEEEPSLDGEAEGEAPIDVTVGMGDEQDLGIGGEEEVMDLTNATEEEVIQALKSLPDDAKIEIVKTPAYDVNITNDAQTEMPIGDEGEADVDMGMEMPIGGEEEETEVDMGMPMGDEGEADVDMGMGDEEEEEEYGEMDESKSVDEMIQEALNEIADVVEEGENLPFDNSVKTNVSKGGENAPYEKKGKQQVKEVVAVDEKLNESKLRKAYKATIRENKRLKSNEVKAVKMLKETMKKLESVATINSQLALTTRLFTEHSTTRKEKESIITKMSKVRTIRESELVFNMLKENLNKRISTKKPIISKVKITESKEGTQKSQVIKEEKTYVDPEQARLLEVMFYKPQG